MNEYIILGVIVSALLEIFKRAFGGLESTKSRIAIISLAVIVGVGYTILQKNEQYLQAVLQILAYASVAYNFIFALIPKKEVELS
jgi:hypothetical protein